MLSASGFAGNECAPELDDAALNAIVPTGSFSPQNEIAFSFLAADVVSDGGEGETAVEDIRIILDPDVDPRFRGNGSTPIGALLTKNDQGTSDVSDDTYDFSWTPTRQQIGNYRLYLIATDLGGTGGTSGTDPIVPLSDVYSFGLKIEKNPTVDLNGDDDTGFDFGPVTFTEGDSAPVSIVDTDLSIPFVSDDLVASATVEILDPQADGLETLGISGGSLVVDDSTPGRLVISVAGGGLASKADFEAALRTLTYNNTSDDPTAMQTIGVTINDGTDDSETALATVKITATNDRPTLLQNEDLANAKVGESYILDLVAEDPDGGDLLVFQIRSPLDFASITPSQPGSSGKNTIQVARDDTDGLFHARILWSPTAAELAAQRALSGDGATLLRVSVTDSSGSADSEDYFVTIENQLPVANDDPTTGEEPTEFDDAFAVSEDEARDVGNILTNDTDADGDTPVVDSVSVSGTAVADPTSFTTAKGALVTLGASGDLNYDPNGKFESLAAGETATDEFEYTSNDQNGGVSASNATVTITIFGRNDAPTVVADDAPEFNIPEDAGPTLLTTATLLAAADDVDNGAVLAIAGAPTNPSGGEGTFSFDAGTGELRFDPDEAALNLAPSEVKEVLFDVEISDGTASVLVPAVIKISGVNDAPVAVNDPATGKDYSTDENTPLTIVVADGVLGNDTDDGTAALGVAEVNGDTGNVGNGTTITEQGGTREGTLTVAADGSFTFNPGGDFDSLAAGESSTVAFTYKATDGSATNPLSNEATVTITVNGLNDAPAAINDSGTAFTIDEDTALSSGNVLDNDNDAEDDTLTVSQVDGVAGDVGVTKNVTSAGGRAGTLSVAANGDVAFTPSEEFDSLAQDAVDTVMFNYTASDGTAESLAAATATITINGVNDGPQIDRVQLASAIQSALGLSSAPDLSQPIDVPVDVAFNFDFSSVVSDVDTSLENLSYSRSETGQTNQPTIDSDGQFTWTPDSTNTAADLTLLLSVIDATVPSDVISDGVQLIFHVIPASS